MPKCERLKCTRPAHKGHRGLCAQHHAKDQDQRAARGEWVFGTEPADRVQNYLDKLHDSGWTYRRIANASGLSVAALFLIRERTNVRADTAVKLYALSTLSPSMLSCDIGQVSAIGSMRRIQALNAIGYSLVYLAGELGMSSEWLSNLTHGRQEFVRTGNAIRIAELFDRLQLKLAPASRAASYARNRASARGWPPPLAWDEDSIDNPDAEPQMPEDDKDAWFEDYEELIELGLSNDQVAERLGIRRESLLARLRRLNAVA